MKKTYKVPALRESKLKALTILAGSLSEGENTLNTGGVDGGSALSKQNSIFDSVFGNDDEVEE